MRQSFKGEIVRKGKIKKTESEKQFSKPFQYIFVVIALLAIRPSSKISFKHKLTCCKTCPQKPNIITSISRVRGRTRWEDREIL